MPRIAEAADVLGIDSRWDLKATHAIGLGDMWSCITEPRVVTIPESYAPPPLLPSGKYFWTYCFATD